jgi:NAD(P)-dependent dehydrogenase (short-subunit alcohol dehydrogenase family)
MLDYTGKHVLVVGGATGMGAAAAQGVAELGAELTVLDVAEVAYPVNEFIRVDLRDRQAVDDVIARLEGPFDALFSCAGVADGTAGLPQINFMSQRRLIEGLLAKGALPRGSAIGVISSTAGKAWREALPQLKEFLAVTDWDAQLRWIEAHKSSDWRQSADGYCFSKRAVCASVAQQAFGLLKKGVRINAVLPGPTDTPLARANADIWLASGADYRAKAGLAHLQPRQLGDALIFLCSPAASGITGENLVIDQGHYASVQMGTYDG